MSHTFRNVLLRSAGAAALLAAGTGFASAQVVTANGGGSTLATPYYESEITNLQVPAFSNDSYNYCSSGSGPAQAAFITNTIGGFGCPPNGAFDSANSAVQPTGYPTTGSVHFAASDAALSTTQISQFNSLNSQQIVQVPSFGTPITLPFHLAALSQKNGGLNLTTDQVCGLLSGQITNWSSIAAASTSAPVTVVYRADGSGTSFLTSQHLGAVCTAANSAFTSFGFAGTTSFASLPFPGGHVPSNFVGVTGSPAIAATVLADANSIAYVSPDLTREAPQNTNNTSLPFVAFVNGVEPNVTNTATALGTATLPTTPTDQRQWVPAVPNPTTGYSIVGYTTLDFATCYQNATIAGELVDFLNVLYNNQPTAGSTGRTMFQQIQNRGFTPLPGQSLSGDATGTFVAAVVSNFITNASGNNLQIHSCTTGR